MGSKDTVAILGVGLIGGSIGMALRARGARVLGIGRDPGRLARAVDLGAIDEWAVEPTAELMRPVGIAVVCTPVDRVAADVLRLVRLGSDRLLVTDAGSTKRAIVEAVEADESARRSFVGAHPIAGSEKNGVEHARGDLFRDRVCVLTPTESTPAQALERTREFWRSIGFRLVEIDPVEHDRRLALTSHLPHALASALAAVVPPEFLAMAAGAYRDCTRVAGAEAGLWSSIFRENRENLLDALGDLRTRLDGFESLLRADDDRGLRDWWEIGRRNRDAYDPENPRITVASDAANV